MGMGRQNRVIAMWCPGHSGIVSNAMADAAAKAGLEGEVEEEEIQKIAVETVGRTCMYGTVGKPGKKVVMGQEGLYKMIKGGMRKWIEKELGKGTKPEDIVAGANTDNIW